MIVNWLLKCRHGKGHWTWPRQKESGKNFVICLDCSAEWEYDSVTFGDQYLRECEDDAKSV